MIQVRTNWQSSNRIRANCDASKVTLTVGAKQEMILSLSPGELAQAVEINGTALAFERTNSTISGTVFGDQIVELPLNGRNWASLATLQPGVVSVRTQEVVTQVGSHARGLGLQLSIDGNRPTQNTYRPPKCRFLAAWQDV